MRRRCSSIELSHQHGIEKDEINSIVHCRALGQEQLFFISRLPINRARLIIITMCQAALSLEAALVTDHRSPITDAITAPFAFQY
eukprot:scaffold225807_cov42-Cyclotella_meneghiniana.AAC.1